MTRSRRRDSKTRRIYSSSGSSATRSSGTSRNGGTTTCSCSGRTSGSRNGCRYGAAVTVATTCSRSRRSNHGRWTRRGRRSDTSWGGDFSSSCRGNKGQGGTGTYDSCYSSTTLFLVCLSATCRIFDTSPKTSHILESRRTPPSRGLSPRFGTPSPMRCDWPRRPNNRHAREHAGSPY